MMLHALIVAGERLAEALRAENEALASLDLSRAAGLSDGKVRATDAFAAACAAAARLPEGRAVGPDAPPEARRAAADLALHLRDLGAENRRLLERAIALQSRVIETIAGAALPRAAPVTYDAGGARPAARRTVPLAVAARV